MKKTNTKNFITMVVLTIVVAFSYFSPRADAPENTCNEDEVCTAYETVEVGAFVLSWFPPVFGGRINMRCRHIRSFHSIPGEISDLVEREALRNWRESVNINTSGTHNFDCPTWYRSIVEFVRYFDIQREDFQAVLDNTREYYVFGFNLDIIYSDDDELIDEYFSTGYLRILEAEEIWFVRGLKWDLWSPLRFDYEHEFARWVATKNADDSWKFSPFNTEFTGDIRQWSIPEFIQAFNISREHLEDIIALRNERDVDWHTFTVDLDAIFVPDRLEELIHEAGLSNGNLAIDPADIDRLIITSAEIFCRDCMNTNIQAMSTRTFQGIKTICHDCVNHDLPAFGGMEEWDEESLRWVTIYEYRVDSTRVRIAPEGFLTYDERLELARAQNIPNRMPESIPVKEQPIRYTETEVPPRHSENVYTEPEIYEPQNQPINDAIHVTIDNTPVVFDGQSPAIIDGRTLMPVRGVFEMLSFEVNWNNDTQTVIITNELYEIAITVGSNVFTTNGVNHTLDVPAQIIGGRTMVPIRLPLESVGFNVNWDGAVNAVLIS